MVHAAAHQMLAHESMLWATVVALVVRLLIVSIMGSVAIIRLGMLWMLL